MKTTVVGDYKDFAAASRVAAELMVSGFAQAEISIVGRDSAHDEARFAYAGALAQGLCGAHESDFEPRLVSGLAHLCVPPRAAARHAGALAQGGGLVAIQSDHERAKRALGVMQRHGPVESYHAGVLPMARAGRGRIRTTGLAHVAEPT
jgi:hypothetical protein